MFLRKGERKITQSKASAAGANGGSYVLLGKVILDHTSDEHLPLGCTVPNNDSLIIALTFFYY